MEDKLRNRDVRWLHWRMKYASEAQDLHQRNAPDRFNQMVENFEMGMCMDSDFSGLGGSHTAMSYSYQDLRARRLLTPNARLVHYRACDKAAASHAVLVNRDQSDEILHVFVDMNDRLPADICDILNNLEPGEDASSDDQRRLYGEMLNVLRESKERCFPLDATSTCLKCDPSGGIRCPVVPTVLDGGSWASSSVSAKRQRVDDDAACVKPWRINAGSNECVGFQEWGREDSMGIDRCAPSPFGGQSNLFVART